MGRLPRKPALYAKLDELGVSYKETMSVKQLEDLVALNTKKTEPKKKRGRKSKKDLLIEQYKELNPHTTINFDELSVDEIEDKINRELEKQMTPYEYFQSVKEAVKVINKDEITRMYQAASELMEKYEETGQEKAVIKLAFHVKTLLKESLLIEKGITKFVQKDDITNFIDNVSKKPVKIIELKNYPREIPDELIGVIKDTKAIFDEFYVVFTDYSGEELYKEVEKERDPILFGGFCTTNRDIVAERFYYLGDWVDEYCDLTLDKLIEETSKDIVKEISIPKNRDELIGQLAGYEERENGTLYYTQSKKPPFFKRIFNALFGKED